MSGLDPEMLLLGSARERIAAESEHLLKRAGFRLTRIVETASPFCVVEVIAVWAILPKLAANFLSLAGIAG